MEKIDEYKIREMVEQDALEVIYTVDGLTGEIESLTGTIENLDTQKQDALATKVEKQAKLAEIIAMGAKSEKAELAKIQAEKEAEEAKIMQMQKEANTVIEPIEETIEE